MPASPRTSTTRPPSRARASSSRSRASSASRPTNGTGRGLRRRAGRAGRRGSGGGRGGAGAHRLVQRGGLLQRRHPELAGQGPDALAVLVQGPGPVARAGEQPDRRLVGGLLQRLEREPPAGDAQRAGQVTGGLPVRRQPGQDRDELLPDGVRLALHPGLEPRGVPHHEALEQLAAGGLGGLLEPALRRQPAEPQHVDVEPGRQRHLVASGHDGVGTEGRAEGGQRATQCTAGVGEVLVGPEQVGDGVARARGSPTAPAGRGRRPPCGCRTRTGAPSRSTRGGPSSRIPITAHLVTDGRLRPPAVTMGSRNDSGTQVRHRRAIGAASIAASPAGEVHHGARPRPEHGASEVARGRRHRARQTAYASAAGPCSPSSWSWSWPRSVDSVRGAPTSRTS